MIVGFTLQTKYIPSKHLTQVHLRFSGNSFAIKDSRVIKGRYLKHQLSITVNILCHCTCLSVGFSFLIGQVRSQGWCKYLSSFFGISEMIDTFPWLQCRAQICAFYLFTFKGRFKCTWNILLSPIIKPPNNDFEC